MKSILTALLLGIGHLVMAQQIFSGVFQQTEAQMVYADKLTASALEGKIKEWNNEGFRPTDIESKLIDGERYYWLIGTKSGLKSRIEQVDSWKDFVKLKRDMVKDGYVITDVEAYALNEIDQHYIGIWHQGDTKHKIWKLDSVEGIEMKTEEMGKGNYYPVNIEVFQTPAKTTGYLVSYYYGPVSSQTYIFASNDPKEFSTDLLQRTKSGYRLIDYQSYPVNDEINYLCIYQRGDYETKLVRNLDRSEFDGLWEMQEKEGLHLVNVHVQ
jgi:hypothetical protein